MNESRELFLRQINIMKYSGLDENIDGIEPYVTELEQQITELKESQKQKQIIKLCERLDEAKRQNKQMLEALIYFMKPNTMMLEDGLYYVKDLKWIVDLIESVTGKKIEEVLNARD